MTENNKRFFQIVYVSQSRSAMNENELKEILSKAANHNKRQNITGVLVYKGGTFVQLIEGPKEAIEELFAKIGQDNRHSKIRRIVTRQTDERLFPEWGMAYKRIEDYDKSLRESIGEFILSHNDGQRIDDDETVMGLLKKVRFVY